MIAARGLVAMLSLLLGACATPAMRDTDDSPPALAARTPTPDAPAAAAHTMPPVVAPTIAEPAVPQSDEAWDPIRAAAPLASCEASPRVAGRIRRYVASPHYLDLLLQRAVAYLPLVHEALAREHVPATFALLPVVESEYRAVPPRGSGPAGLWQLMPVTARAQGLTVSRARDQRLDPVASTAAAARLLAYLGERFEDDWPLATMAFNAGEFRVRGALRRQAQSAGPSWPAGTDAAAKRAALALPPITHDHFAKLVALACIVREPDRYGIVLPAADADTRWVAVRAPHPLHYDRAVALSGVPRQQFARVNAGLRAPLIEAGQAWLVPGRAALPLSDTLAQLDADTARRSPSGAIARVPAVASVESRDDGHYLVRAGDSLWLIAQRLSLRVNQLIEWNALPRSATLRPGQLLRVVPPTR